jgi:hypothetical protein
MAVAPYRLVTLPNGQRVSMPTSQVRDFLAGQAADTTFQDSASMPIPGMMNGRPAAPSTAPYQGLMNNTASGALSQYMNTSMTPDQWRGLLPNSQQIPRMPPGQFQPMGPYGSQAMSDAGLLGANQPATGLLGAKRPYTMMMGGKYGK